jgi:hypothetical protein
VSVSDGRDAFERSRGRGDHAAENQHVTTRVDAGRELHRTGRVPDIQTGEEGTEVTS